MTAVKPLASNVVDRVPKTLIRALSTLQPYSQNVCYSSLVQERFAQQRRTLRFPQQTTYLCLASPRFLECGVLNFNCVELVDRCVTRLHILPCGCQISVHYESLCYLQL